MKKLLVKADIAARGKRVEGFIKMHEMMD